MTTAVPMQLPSTVLPDPPRRPRLFRTSPNRSWAVEVDTPGRAGALVFHGETIELALESAVNGLSYFLWNPSQIPARPTP